ncbi:hypothetical protein MKX01_031149 [Papaver californicum]|nr:hypothetical protein MKX01_031149 [Papaver californicum]
MLMNDMYRSITNNDKNVCFVFSWWTPWIRFRQEALFFNYKYNSHSHSSIHPSIHQSQNFHHFQLKNLNLISNNIVGCLLVVFLHHCLRVILRTLKEFLKMSSATTCVNQVQGFECEKTEYKTTTSCSATANSLRRTLSATDMSCKIADQIQDVEPKNDFAQQKQQPGQIDIWCSILIQKPSSLPPPYVHPLVKKSKSCLSLKSLEICTENLGSESGSDGYPHSDISLSDTEEEHEEIEQVVEEEAIQQVVVEEKKEVVVMNYGKKASQPSATTPRCFPPPLKSLSKPGGGGIQMKTHRKDGRLVLEAVSLPTSQNCFNAQRQDGRLVLTFSSPIPESKSLEDVLETDEEVEFEFSPDNEIEEPIIEEEEDNDNGVEFEMIITTVLPKLQPTGVMNVHRSALMSNKFIGMTNSMNTTISPPSLAAGEAPPRVSTLPQQSVAAAATGDSFNRYKYCWRKETPSMVSVGGIYHSLNQQSLPNTKNSYSHNNNSNNLLTSKNNYYINNNSNDLFVKDSVTTTNGGKDYKEEKQNSKGAKIVEHLIVSAYCKQEPRRSLDFQPSDRYNNNIVAINV